MELKLEESKLSRELRILQRVVRCWLSIRAVEKSVRVHVHRTKVAREVYESELNYLRDITTLNELCESCAEVLTPVQREAIFANIKQIVQIHRRLAEELRQRIATWSYHTCIVDIFLKYVCMLGREVKGSVLNHPSIVDGVQML